MKPIGPIQNIVPTCAFCGSKTSYCETKLDSELCALNKHPVCQPPVMESKNVETILEERGSRYGSFQDNARISQRLCEVFREECEMRIKRGQVPLTYYEREAIEMIFAKICRIVSGDPRYADNWDDIAGYAALGKNPR